MRRRDGQAGQEQLESERPADADWKREIRQMFEEVLSRTLEDVLSRKLDEVGLVGLKRPSRLQPDHTADDRPLPTGSLRRWSATRLPRTSRRSDFSLDSIMPSIPTMPRSVLASPRLSWISQKDARERASTPSPDASAPSSLPPGLPDVGSQCALKLPGALALTAPKAPSQVGSEASQSMSNTANDTFSEERQTSKSSSAKATAKDSGHSLGASGRVPRAWGSSFEDEPRRPAPRRSARPESSTPGPPGFRLRMSRKAMTRALPASFRRSSFPRLVCATVVTHRRFDLAMALATLLSAASMGISADSQARHLTDDELAPLVILEKLLCLLFLAELLLRLNAYRVKFFCGPGCVWNFFDLFVVSSQLVEGALELVCTRSQQLGSAGIFRLLGLVRVLRLVRLLWLIRELRVLVSSISTSVKSLFWVVVLMMLMIFAVSLCITQLVSERRRSIQESGGIEREELAMYYGSVPRSMLSLFEAITGGVDWDVLVIPLLEEVHPLMPLVLVVYVAVAQFAIMNVITGMFVESVLAIARTEKEQFLLDNAKELFGMIEGEMDWESFRGKLDDPKMLNFFKGIDVDPSDAQQIFSLIDVDRSGAINAGEFLNSCIRLHGPSTAIETAVLLQEVRSLREDVVRALDGMAS